MKLFTNYKIQKNSNLIEPDEVILATEAYKNDNDVYDEFIKERIEKD